MGNSFDHFTTTGRLFYKWNQINIKQYGRDCLISTEGATPRKLSGKRTVCKINSGKRTGVPPKELNSLRYNRQTGKKTEFI